MTADIVKTIRERHSTREPFDPVRPVKKQDLKLILEAARWAPTANNMQNFEILLVDAKDRLDAIAKIPAEMSEAFYVRTMSSSPSLKKNCRLRRPAC
jgi:nitroreductase